MQNNDERRYDERQIPYDLWEYMAAGIHVGLRTGAQQNNPFFEGLWKFMFLRDEVDIDQWRHDYRRRYYPKLAVGFLDQKFDRIFVSTPHDLPHKLEGYHVERQLIESCTDETGKVQHVECISTTYSPCATCTILIAKVFEEQQPKPIIEFFIINGSTKYVRNISFFSLSILAKMGFRIRVMSHIPFKQHLLTTPRVPQEVKDDLKKSLEMNNHEMIRRRMFMQSELQKRNIPQIM